MGGMGKKREEEGERRKREDPQCLKCVDASDRKPYHRPGAIIATQQLCSPSRPFCFAVAFKSFFNLRLISEVALSDLRQTLFDV